VIVAARAEWIKAERLLPLAGDGNDDRGPFDAVRLPAEQLPVGVKHYVQTRPGTDLVPSGAVLGHGLLHRRRCLGGTACARLGSGRLAWHCVRIKQLYRTLERLPCVVPT
jgi:hypothetical protein